MDSEEKMEEGVSCKQGVKELQETSEGQGQKVVRCECGLVHLLFTLLLLQSGRRIRESHIQLLGSFDDGQSFASGDVVSDFSDESVIVHEEELEILWVGQQELLEAVGKHEASLLVGAIAGLGHADSPTELPTHTVVYASGLPPVGLMGR